MRTNDLVLYIGRQADGSYVNGIIDEVRIYNRALSAEEIKQHYLGSSPKRIYKDATTGTVYDSIPSNKLVEITFPKPPENEFYLTVLTKNKGLYSWWIS